MTRYGESWRKSSESVNHRCRPALLAWWRVDLLVPRTICFAAVILILCGAHRYASWEVESATRRAEQKMLQERLSALLEQDHRSALSQAVCVK